MLEPPRLDISMRGPCENGKINAKQLRSSLTIELAFVRH